MEIRRLGDRGPLVSIVGLGCNNFGMRLDRRATERVVGAALDAGVTHFDTAELYGDGRSEEFLGRALGPHRDEVVIATKFAPRPPDQPSTPGALRTRILEACDLSLRRLGTDRIDLYYQHFWDSEAPLEEVRDAFAKLHADGKVRCFASSRVTADQIDDGASANVGFVATEIEWSLLRREVEDSVVPAARRHGLGIVPFYPLASGLLSGKYHRGQPFPKGSRMEAMPYFTSIATDENLRHVERLRAWANARGRSILELAIAWLASHDEVSSVITGATTPEQVRENVAAAEAWRLTREELVDVPRVVFGPTHPGS
jgi:aryl-alcohol dehydrogenase-like predicted oxidoreductase